MGRTQVYILWGVINKIKKKKDEDKKNTKKTIRPLKAERPEKLQGGN